MEIPSIAQENVKNKNMNWGMFGILMPSNVQSKFWMVKITIGARVGKKVKI